MTAEQNQQNPKPDAAAPADTVADTQSKSEDTAAPKKKRSLMDRITAFFFFWPFKIPAVNRFAHKAAPVIKKFVDKIPEKVFFRKFREVAEKESGKYGGVKAISYVIHEIAFSLWGIILMGVMLVVSVIGEALSSIFDENPDPGSIMGFVNVVAGITLALVAAGSIFAIYCSVGAVRFQKFDESREDDVRSVMGAAFAVVLAVAWFAFLAVGFSKTAFDTDTDGRSNDERLEQNWGLSQEDRRKIREFDSDLGDMADSLDDVNRGIEQLGRMFDD